MKYEAFLREATKRGCYYVMRDYGANVYFDGTRLGRVHSSGVSDERFHSFEQMLAIIQALEVMA